MIVKVKIEMLRYEYLEIPEHLKEDYHNDIELKLKEDESPKYHNLKAWARSKGVTLPVADI